MINAEEVDRLVEEVRYQESLIKEHRQKADDAWRKRDEAALKLREIWKREVGISPWGWGEE